MLALAIEYQGEGHYVNTPVWGGTVVRQNSDTHKQIQADSYGVTLVTVPFWWNSSNDNLIATILQKRPDLKEILPSISPTAQPIVQEISEEHLKLMKKKFAKVYKVKK
jgi:hypothetical protein